MHLTPKLTWSETEASLEVTVDVPGVSRNKADISATDVFLKVNCPPYLLALDLFKEVDDTRSSATVVPSGVIFKLFKREPGLWGRLAAEGDKAALTERRNASIDRMHAAAEEARRARLTRRQQEDKNATQRSMDVDRRKRQEVDRRKAEELAEERGRLAEWQAGLSLKEQADAESDYEDEGPEGEEGEEEGDRQGTGSSGRRRTGTTDQDPDPEAPAPDHPDYHGKGWRSSSSKLQPEVGGGGGAAALRERGKGAVKEGYEAEEYEEEDDRGRARDEEEDEEEEEKAGPVASAARGQTFKPLPPPRAKLAPVPVSFTKLETGHLPAREQREEEIRAYKKQVRSEAADADSVDLADRQPLFLKDKGDGLFRSGNLAGALNAYNRAIALDDSHATVRANRAACRLAAGDAAACVEDCDRALELLAEARGRLDRGVLEPAEATAVSRQIVRLLVRRAQARVALMGVGASAAAAAAGGRGAAAGAEALAGAVGDYEDAMRLYPSDPSLESDYQELMAALKPADSAALRQRGDARFRSADYEGAAEAFSALLQLPRVKVPESERLAAFSNRAACHLVLERYAAAVADCDAGLALLLPTSTSTSTSTTAATGNGPAAGPLHEFGAAAGQRGLALLSEWAQTMSLPADPPEFTEAAAGAAAGGGTGACGLAPAAAAAAAARLLSRRGGAAAHLQHFTAAAADYRTAAGLLRRLGEVAKAEAAEADAERMRSLAEGREAVPIRQEPAAAPAEVMAETVSELVAETNGTKAVEIMPNGAAEVRQVLDRGDGTLGADEAAGGSGNPVEGATAEAKGKEPTVSDQGAAEVGAGAAVPSGHEGTTGSTAEGTEDVAGTPPLPATATHEAASAAAEAGAARSQPVGHPLSVLDDIDD